MKSSLDVQREREQEYWNGVRQRQAGKLLSVDSVRANELRPCYEGEGDLYSENRALFHQIILGDGGWEGRHVLDYCSGLGNWSIYYGLTGAAKVTGFDMAAKGIEAANEHAARQGLQDKVRLVVADATDLPFADGEFDIVIGHGVIHHTIKYPGIFENLYRVMKPGTKAYFHENLADFPLWRLWWWWKGEVPEGDVPIFSNEVREKARMFSKVEIIGDSFVHSIKTVVYKKGMSDLRRRVLRASHRTDDWLFARMPWLRDWGSMSVIILTKAP
ncbi:MAG: class I SAM-dependent methyltransferase [Lautropia sp.]